jgi:hypothetical protein
VSSPPWALREHDLCIACGKAKIAEMVRFPEPTLRDRSQTMLLTEIILPIVENSRIDSVQSRTNRNTSVIIGVKL